MSANKLTVTRHGNDVRITLPNGVEFMFHSGDPWAIGSENIAHKAMLCLFDRISALEAEKAERERQEPVAFRWLGPGKGWRPVYAHPLALREPTEDECSRIAIEAGYKLHTEAARIAIGRSMVRAVMEVMK